MASIPASNIPINALPYPEFETTDQGIKSLLFDADKWTPYIREVCNFHNIDASVIKCIPQGLEGSTPVFIVGERVIKFFIPLPTSDGEEVYNSELLSFGLLNQCPIDEQPKRKNKNGPFLDPDETTSEDKASGSPDVYIPRVLFHGKCLDHRPEKNEYMYYVITRFLHGEPYELIWPTLDRSEKIKLAFLIGQTVAQFHTIKHFHCLEDQSKTWHKFIQEMTETVTHSLQTKYVPQSFLDQVTDYLPKDFTEFLDSGTLAFIHTDLHRSHIFLTQEPNKDWKITGLLDWGDSCFGDPFYELATIHADLFHADRELLKHFLDGYAEYSSAYQRPDFVYRAMVFFILYKYNHFQHRTKPKGVFQIHPEYRDLASWDALADELFNVEKGWDKETK